MEKSIRLPAVPQPEIDHATSSVELSIQQSYAEAVKKGLPEKQDTTVVEPDESAN
jgi:hypothetical protein